MKGKGFRVFHIISKCGHEIKNCSLSPFIYKDVGIVCNNCSKLQAIEKNKEKIKDDKLVYIKQEYNGYLFFKEQLSCDFIVKKTEGYCLSDFYIKPKNIKVDEWLPIQLKVTYGLGTTQQYLFHIHKKYSNMPVLCLSMNNKKIWIFNGNDILNKKRITIGEHKSMYD